MSIRRITRQEAVQITLREFDYLDERVKQCEEQQIPTNWSELAGRMKAVATMLLDFATSDAPEITIELP